MPVWQTTLTDAKGKPRVVDDYQPRVQISDLFKDGSLDLKNNDKIDMFAKTYAVDSGLVKKYIEHLQDIEHRKTIRTNQRKVDKQDRNDKSYDSYKWEELSVNGQLKKLKVHELDKYLNYNKLNTTGKKLDKVKRITCHICRSQTKKVQALVTQHKSVEETDSEISDNDSQDEFIAVSIGSSEDEDMDDTIDDFQCITTTRSGRVAGTWKNTFF